MNVDTELYKLSISFNAEQLQKEVTQFGDSDWIVHASEAAGDASLPLISVGGRPNCDLAISGPMRLTKYLAQCPYLQQVLQAFGSPLSRCRLVRRVVRFDEQINLVSEQNYHWFRRRPIYVPIITDAAVTFAYGEQRIQLAAGEAWTFDPKIPHGFIYETDNRAADNTIDFTVMSLVIETKGSARLTEMLAQAQKDHRFDQELPSRNRIASKTQQLLPNPVTPYHWAHGGHLSLEPYSFYVLTPQEIGDLMAALLAEVKDSQISQNEFAELARRLDAFQCQWRQTFDRFGHWAAGELAYQELLL